MKINLEIGDKVVVVSRSSFNGYTGKIISVVEKSFNLNHQVEFDGAPNALIKDSWFSEHELEWISSKDRTRVITERIEYVVKMQGSEDEFLWNNITLEAAEKLVKQLEEATPNRSGEFVIFKRTITEELIT